MGVETVLAIGASVVGGAVQAISASHANSQLKKQERADEAAAQAANDQNQNALKSARVSLLETEGGQLGEELDPNEVQTRDTLLGN